MVTIIATATTIFASTKVGVEDRGLWARRPSWRSPSPTSSLSGTWTSQVSNDGDGDLLERGLQPHSLFLAPELLTLSSDGFSSSTTKTAMYNCTVVSDITTITIIRLGERAPVGGSQKGDVYSFAIILYEIHGRSQKQSSSSGNIAMNWHKHFKHHKANIIIILISKTHFTKLG